MLNTITLLNILRLGLNVTSYKIIYTDIYAWRDKVRLHKIPRVRIPCRRES